MASSRKSEERESQLEEGELPESDVETEDVLVLDTSDDEDVVCLGSTAPLSAASRSSRREHSSGGDRGGGPRSSSRHQAHNGSHAQMGGQQGSAHAAHYVSDAARHGLVNPAPSSCLYVKGLRHWIREADIARVFAPFPGYQKVVLPHHHQNRECRGYAYVYYSSTDQAKKALDSMKGALIDGHPMTVAYSATDHRRPGETPDVIALN